MRNNFRNMKEVLLDIGEFLKVLEERGIDRKLVRYCVRKTSLSNMVDRIEVVASAPDFKNNVIVECRVFHKDVMIYDKEEWEKTSKEADEWLEKIKEIIPEAKSGIWKYAQEK